MTTAQRAKQIIADIRSPGFPSVDMDEVASILESHARMLEAAVPETIKAIEQRCADTAIESIETDEQEQMWRRSQTMAPRDRATLLDAYRVLADKVERLDRMNQVEHAEHNAARLARQAQIDTLRDKRNAAVSDLIMKVNVVTGERDAARAEVERLRADVAAAAGELAIPIPEPGTDMARVCIANRLLKYKVEEEKQRADRLAEQLAQMQRDNHREDIGR